MAMTQAAQVKGLSEHGSWPRCPRSSSARPTSSSSSRPASSPAATSSSRASRHGLLVPEVQERYAFGSPPSAPSARAMWTAWRKITKAADRWLDTLTTRKLQDMVVVNGKPTDRMYGNLLQRVIYHYWYHIGEDMAVRKILGHAGFGYFVGNIDTKAPYTPERGSR